MNTVEQILIFVLTVAAATGATAAWLAYTKLAPWWETWVGRMYWTLLLVLTGALWLLVVNRALNGDITRTAWIFVCLLLAAALWGNFAVIIHTQRKANEHEESP